MMEEENDELEDIENSSYDSFIVDSDDDDEPSIAELDDGLHTEETLTEEEIQELISDFLEVESEAAEAQEALEKESLAKVESEVREELSQTLSGDDLETGIADEMATLIEEWEDVLDELETEGAHLLEQLDGAAIELPSLYKMIESQAPNVCHTEAWKKRAHWVGSQVTTECTNSVADAENYLQIQRPVRRRHGKLLEEGASGFLQKKLATDGSKDAITDNSEVDWCSLNRIFSEGASEDHISFGSKHWASVYLASTPQQASMMGIKFPGVNEVEKIDGDFNDPFVADALANEKEPILSEEQRKNYRKVKEEDDASKDKKLRRYLKQRRLQKRFKQDDAPKEVGSGDWMSDGSLDEPSSISHSVSDAPTCEAGGGLPKNDEVARENLDRYQVGSFETSKLMEEKLIDNGTLSVSSTESRGTKRSNESEKLNTDNKKGQTVVIDCDGEEQASANSNRNVTKMEDQTVLRVNVDDSVDASSPPVQNLYTTFQCTACNKRAVQVHSHPLLKVIICRDCERLLEEKMCVMDPECSVCYCVWCGQTSDLISCKSCKTLFCVPCIKRNIGEEALSDVSSSGWQCCRCSPGLLQELTSELERALESRTQMASSSNSDSENSEADDNVSISSKRKQKKKIQRILDDAELGEETKRKIAIEKERQERLKSLQVQFSEKSQMTSSSSCNRHLPEGASVEVLGDSQTGYIVNVVRENGEEAVRIPQSVSAKLKAHQVAGIRFMWENIIQSTRKVRAGDKGLGCILAHMMGLGKTFQVIAFLYTAMRAVDLGLKTALIVTPLNVLHNWRHEFMKWKPSEIKPLRVFMLEDVSRERRAEVLAKWRAKGGVFLIGYTAFRNLSLGRNMKDRHMAREISYALQNGPDILVCDEAHIIKNTRADTTQALKQVKCHRRIALTGSPLQNNLMEYFCMVDFVRGGFLGSSHKFRNRFQNPIENGQHINSTADDVKIMNQRSHILYEQLKGFVQRMDMSVVQKDLPPKAVYVLAVKLSPLQRKLYKKFLDVHEFTNGKVSNEKIRKSFFAGYQALAQIWNHPGILQLRREKKDYMEHEDAVENFLGDDISSDENIDNNTIVGEKPSNTNDDGFLCKFPRHGKSGKLWKKGKDWYRLDGRTESSERQKLVEQFNQPSNRRVKCTLISTKAGSLGINLHAANRVIIVDGSWNPTYDLQAIYRAWRYGQKKPVYAYRLMAHGTMEEKIYKRQVTKEGLAARVVDRQQVHRTISREEMLHLFEFGDDENPDVIAERSQENGRACNQISTCHVGNSPKPGEQLSNGGFVSDRLIENLVAKHYPRWIVNYHEHETLLQENKEEKLSKEEQDMAWEVYRRALEGEEVQRVPLNESEQKPPVSNVAPVVSQARSFEPSSRFYRNYALQRKCTNLSHMLTLRSQDIKIGCTTVCGECAQEISWKGLNREGRMVM